MEFKENETKVRQKLRQSRLLSITLLLSTLESATQSDSEDDDDDDDVNYDVNGNACLPKTESNVFTKCTATQAPLLRTLQESNETVKTAGYC